MKNQTSGGSFLFPDNYREYFETCEFEACVIKINLFVPCPERCAAQSESAQVLYAGGEREGRRVDGGRGRVLQAAAAEDERVRSCSHVVCGGARRAAPVATPRHVTRRQLTCRDQTLLKNHACALQGKGGRLLHVSKSNPLRKTLVASSVAWLSSGASRPLSCPGLPLIFHLFSLFQDL